MQTSEKDRTRRPRSFVGGGGSFEFTYDRHYGGIRDPVQPQEVEERKPRRPLSLYESLSKDMQQQASRTARTNSATSPSHENGDGGKAFAKLNTQEKADEVNKDKEKVTKTISMDKGDEGLGTRTSSDASSRKAARALYAELSSPPPKTGVTDDKFNAVSRLRSLFDQGNAAPAPQRSFSRGLSKDKRLPSQDSTEESKITKQPSIGEGKPDNTTRRPKFERVEAEKRKKLFASPPPVKLDDLLKRDSPRGPKSPEETKPLQFRRSTSKENIFPSKKIETQKSEDINVEKESTTSRSTASSTEDDEFEKIHKRRRSIPKKRSSSFEFEGLEENVAVYGKSSIDINSILGLDPPKEETVEETKEVVVESEVAKEVEASCEDERKAVEEVLEVKAEEVVEGSPEEEPRMEAEGLEAKEKEDGKPETKEGSSSSSSDSSSSDSSDCEAEEKAEDQTTKEEQAETKEVVAEESLHIEIKEDAAINLAIVIDKEEEQLPKDEDKLIIEEDILQPELQEQTESAIDFEALQDTDVVSESNDSVVMECDSFDSFALDIRKSNEQAIEVKEELDLEPVEKAVDENANITVTEEMLVEAELPVSESMPEEDVCEETESTEDVTNVDISMEVNLSVGDGVVDEVVEVIVEEPVKQEHGESECELEIEEAVTEPTEQEPAESENELESEEAVAEPAEQEPAESECEQEDREAEMEPVDAEEEEIVVIETEEVESANVEKSNIEDNAEEENEAEDEDETEIETPGIQLSIIAKIAGLTKDEDEDAEITTDGITTDHLQETVELDDEEYDHTASDLDNDDSTSAVSSDTPCTYDITAEVEEGIEETIEAVSEHEQEHEPEHDLDHETEHEPESLVENEGDDTTTTLDDSEQTLQLPPAPAQSCLNSKKNGDKKGRKVSFHNEGNDIIFTYSPDEYNRSNREIDALAASAEWELEKRVDEKDIFSVDLDKRDGGLGLSIIGLGVGTESGVEKLGIFVKSLTPNGAAYKDRRIQMQDQILEVNGISLVGVTQDFAANTLRNTSGKVRFLMGRDNKTKVHYQAPTSTAEPVLQELERKHNLVLGELHSKVQKAENRATVAEHNLDEIKEALLEAEDKIHALEAEIANAREEIEVMKESPFYPPRRSLKNEIKRPKYEKRNTEKIENLEKSITSLTKQLSCSEENLDKIQSESDAKVEELKGLLEEAEKANIEVKNENNNLVSSLQSNAEKLREAETNLAEANRQQEEKLKEVQELKEKCGELEAELERLRESQVLLEELVRLKEEEAKQASVIAVVEDQVDAAVAEPQRDDDEKERLMQEIENLNEEVNLRNQFADIIVAERDHLKTLVNNLERARERELEDKEKKEIETAVKKMSYENKIKELEETIKELQRKQSTEGKEKKKLFPDIDRISVEKEIEIEPAVEVRAEAEVELPVKKEVEIQIKEATPVQSTPKTAQFYELPPRDYDFETPPRDYIDGPVIDKAKVIVEVDIDDKPLRKTSISSSSNSESNEEKQVTDVEEPITESTELVAESANEVLETGTPEIEINEAEVPVVMPEIELQIEVDKPEEKVEQPVIEVAINMDNASPVSVVIENNDGNKVFNHSEEGVDKVDGVVPDVNPIQKPPRTYSDAAEVRHDKSLRPYSVNENKAVEVIAERDEVTVEEPIVEESTVEEQPNKVSDVIEVKRGEKFDLLITRDIIDEPELQRPLDESLFKVLPESSVDSDSEVLADAERESPQAHEESFQIQVIDKDIPQHNPDATDTDAPSNDRIPRDSPTEGEGDAQGDAKADRSSFLEAFSKNPTFGSWFSGESTIVEQDKTEAQAEEIASQVVEGKVRALSSSSSSSSSSSESEKPKEDLNSSIKLDESYLQQSQTDIDHDIHDSPLTRLESVDVGSPLQAQAAIDDAELLAAAPAVDRPKSTNFDDLPVAPVLDSGAQRDKKRVASAIPRKSPRSLPRKAGLEVDVKTTNVPQTESISEGTPSDDQPAPSSLSDAPPAATASTDNLAVNIDYAKPDKEKRKSFFSFLPKLGGKKKHKRSMENLLEPEVGAGNSAPVPELKDNHEDDGSVVPLEMKGEVNVDVRISTDSGFETQQTVNGTTDSAPLSASPASEGGIGSTENIAEDIEDGRSLSSKSSDRQSWIQRPVQEWDVRQVGLWMIRLGLEEYAQTFQERSIDGAELLNLNGARLKDLGVLHGDHRALIKKKIKEFRSNSDSKPKDSKGKSKEKTSKKIFWKGKYTVNQ